MAEMRKLEKMTLSRPIHMVGRSPAMQKVFQLINLVADKNSTVLVTGESGTGKELAARVIHSRSSRKKNPFVATNCGAIPENLLEDELFGHVRAYTDARRERTGRFEQADEGTLFLDEIGELSPSLQVKLLRVLEENQFQKLGSNKTIQVDVRILVATHCDLREKVRKKEFREDLFYRLNVVPMHMPPLRERKEDLPLLVSHFLHELAHAHQLAPKQLSPGALKRLMRHDWRGNVRQLRNILELASVLAGDESTILKASDFATLDDEFALELASAEMFQDKLQLPETGLDLRGFVQELEKHLIDQALEREGGNKRRAARLLGLKRTTLVAKLRRLNSKK